MNAALFLRRHGVTVYRDMRDWWVGLFRDTKQGCAYICPLPTLVVRWDPPSRRCPDGAYCRTRCFGSACFRTQHGQPLPGAYPRDAWPAAVVAAEAEKGDVGWW